MYEGNGRPRYLYQDGFMKWVLAHKAFECLRKQPGSTAIKERWDAGEEVPGVEALVKISLSLTKV